MSIGHNSGREPLDARRLAQTLAIYCTPSHARSIAELAITAVPLVALWMAAWFTFWLGYAWATPLIAIPAAGFLVRLFMIQHDCGHGTFFSRRRANDWVGRVIGVLTLTPYDFWRRTHAIHHATRRQSRPPRHWRRRYADRARISRVVALGPAEIPALPPSAGDVRPRSGLSVPAAAPPAGRADAPWLAALGQHAWRPIWRSR